MDGSTTDWPGGLASRRSHLQGRRGARGSGTIAGVVACERTRGGVVVGRIDPIAACGLLNVLHGEHQLDVRECDVEDASLEGVQFVADVVIVGQDYDLTRLVDRLRAVRSQTGIVVFAADPTPTYGMLALAHRVSCVASNVSAAELIASVHSASRGKQTFVWVSGGGIERVDAADVKALTKREREVAVYLSEDASHGEIAHALQIGVRTVETYAGGVRRKLRARDRRDLAGMPIPTTWRAGS